MWLPQKPHGAPHAAAPAPLEQLKETYLASPICKAGREAVCGAPAGSQWANQAAPAQLALPAGRGCRRARQAGTMTKLDDARQQSQATRRGCAVSQPSPFRRRSRSEPSAAAARARAQTSHTMFATHQRVPSPPPRLAPPTTARQPRGARDSGAPGPWARCGPRCAALIGPA